MIQPKLAVAVILASLVALPETAGAARRHGHVVRHPAARHHHYIYRRPAYPQYYARNGRNARCYKICPSDMNPCDPIYFKMFDSRCEPDYW
jgi:hypothetical protein